MAERCWEHFEHGADVGVRGFGPTRVSAFEQAARALTAILADPDKVADRESVVVACRATDDEILLFDWLNAVAFEMATRSMLFGRFEVSIEDGWLTGTLYGEAVDAARHAPTVEVKGATFTALKVGRDATGQWIAQCVVDV